MKKRQLHLKNSLALLAVASLFSLGQPARAQSAPAQDKDTPTVRDNDTTRAELAQFDQFLDSHPEIAEQLRKDPSLVNSKDFVEKHPALQTYLQQQSAVREELKENPWAFMRDENRFDRTEDARARDTRGDEARFDQFLDSHREIAEQLRKDPSLANNREFVEKHAALQTFLQEQPGIRDQLKDNPNAFVRRADLAERQDDRFDRRDDARDRDTHARFGEFLGGHDDVAKDLSRNHFPLRRTTTTCGKASRTSGLSEQKRRRAGRLDEGSGQLRQVGSAIQAQQRRLDGPADADAQSQQDA